MVIGLGVCPIYVADHDSATLSVPAKLLKNGAIAFLAMRSCINVKRATDYTIQLRKLVTTIRCLEDLAYFDLTSGAITASGITTPNSTAPVLVTHLKF